MRGFKIVYKPEGLCHYYIYFNGGLIGIEATLEEAQAFVDRQEV